jgi:hypothetical protein
VGNNASYAALVQDEDHQTKMHEETGWPTIQKIVEDEGPEVVRMMSREIERMLRK